MKKEKKKKKRKYKTSVLQLDASFILPSRRKWMKQTPRVFRSIQPFGSNNENVNAS